MVFRRLRSQSRYPALLRGRASLALLLGVLLYEHAASAKLDDELLQLQRVAVARAGLSESATTRLLARQHLAALLPQVRVTLGQGWQISATGRVLDGLTAAQVDNDHTSYAVSAGWDLSRLLAPREALQVHHEEPKRARQRLAVQIRVARLLASRCRLLQLDAPSAGQRQQAAELEAALDLVTGGQTLPVVTPTTNCPAPPRFTIGSVPRSAHRSVARPADEVPELEFGEPEFVDPEFDD